jgi:hypothetical protein
MNFLRMSTLDTIVPLVHRAPRASDGKILHGRLPQTSRHRYPKIKVLPANLLARRKPSYLGQTVTANVIIAIRAPTVPLNAIAIVHGSPFSRAEEIHRTILVRQPRLSALAPERRMRALIFL